MNFHINEKIVIKNNVILGYRKPYIFMFTLGFLKMCVLKLAEWQAVTAPRMRLQGRMPPILIVLTSAGFA